MDKILVIGACGQIGVELTLALRSIFGSSNVIATDLREAHALLRDSGPYLQLDAMDAHAVADVARKNEVTHIYLLAALLSATGEKEPKRAWDLNMKSLLQILDIAIDQKIKKVYWPSSIAVFGPTTPAEHTPQETIIEPRTVYGISKYAGELWCQYYHQRWGVDVRSLRYPGLISWKGEPGGGTTDYAIEVFHYAIKGAPYECFLSADTYLPMMYMDDAIRATIELMEADSTRIKSRMAYNIGAMSFSPKEIAESIRYHVPDFQITYRPDFRQQIADGWPRSVDDRNARNDWGWQHQFDLNKMTYDMLKHLKK